MLDIEAKLAALGRTALAVAASLAREGITGIPGSVRCCPLARYLHREYPGHVFEVTGNRIQIDGEGRCVTPSGCADFVHYFDAGRFSDSLLDVAATRAREAPAEGDDDAPT